MKAYTINEHGKITEHRNWEDFNKFIAGGDKQIATKSDAVQKLRAAERERKTGKPVAA